MSVTSHNPARLHYGDLVADGPVENAAQGRGHPWPWRPWSGVVPLCHTGLTTWPSTQRCARTEPG